MKKTNVMIEVSEEIYESIVSPYKKKKSFGKLVVHLLEAYAENDSIYSYINGTMDSIEDEATEELLKDLTSMAESLSMMGMLGSQAEAIIDNGHKEFKDVGAQARKEYESGTISKEETGSKQTESPLSREDIVSIVHESMSDIKSDIKEMLKEAIMGMSFNAPKEEMVDKKVEESTVEQSFFTEKKDSVISREPLFREIETEVSEEAEEKAKDALSSLMSSISF